MPTSAKTHHWQLCALPRQILAEIYHTHFHKNPTKIYLFIPSHRQTDGATYSPQYLLDLREHLKLQQCVRLISLLHKPRPAIWT